MTCLRATIAFTLLGTFAASPIAHANPNDPVYTTIDSYRVETDRTIYVNGILQGAAAATELRFTLNNTDATKRCDALALMAMSRPGKYLLRIDTLYASGTYSGCSLIRR